jgi:hypothetical protein
MAFATEEQRKTLQDDDRDQFVCGVPAPWVPEHDVFLTNSLLKVLPGWRSILVRLVQRQLVTIHLARKYFSTSLMEADYDFLPYEEKKRLADNA